MCISIVFCVKPEPAANAAEVENSIKRMALNYGYGCGVGLPALVEKVALLVKDRFPDYRFFEIHDLQEPHCACDIDHDIRIKSKLGERSTFFNLVHDILNFDKVEEFSILFTENEVEEGLTIREDSGGLGAFCERLNNWYTWQVEGFDPIRQAYYIADSSPYLYTFIPGLSH
ncbi:hypothetical protein [Thermincola potens]|uniref:Uncharacterized protein n=1 Tax=Thermincola potens (strain JR) TaxID=635013 RepID=D5XE36_THEPJ|nr:hypothetical protein [Thermincola potens]ADG81907.1 hypothetical protein TherJR_1042 [Thermincola potens JR]